MCGSIDADEVPHLRYLRCRSPFVTECARAGAPMTAATVGGRGAGRAQATRASLLAAARGVFSESGFAEANIADVVSRAGASVGSLYHHFGGKADLRSEERRV